MRKYKNYWLIFITFFLGIAFSLILYFTLNKWEGVNRQHTFQIQAQTTIHAIENELSSFTNALNSVGEFIQLSPDLTREQFKQFSTNHLVRNPSILAFSWNLMVLEAERHLYVERMAKEGFENIDIKRASPEGDMLTDARQGYYFPVYFIEPFQRFSPILGFNFTSEKIRHEAVKLAFNQQKLTATEKIILVDQEEDINGILLVQPIYHQNKNNQIDRENKRGVLIEAIDINALFSQTLLDINQQNANLLLLDMTASASQQILYSSPEINRAELNVELLFKEDDSELYWGKNVNFANRKWKIIVFPKQYLSQFTTLSVSWVSFLCSLLFTFVFCQYWLKRHHSTLETVINARQYSIANKKLSEEIIERLKVEKRLIKFAHAFQLSADGINLLDIDGDYSYCNKASIELYGYQADEMENLHYYDINQDPAIQELDLLNQVKRQGTWQGEFPQTRKDGTKFRASISLSLIKDETGNDIGILEITRDITEASLMETQLQQAKKMEALGTLAGGIAHDFNNILASILGNSEMILMSKIDPSKTRSYISNIQESCTRAADLVKQIMTFSRMETMQLNTIDLAKVVNDALTIIRASLPANIHISCSIDPHCPPIKGDVTQIHQILLNLCANASQAIGDNSGTIAIDLHQEATMSYDNQKIAKDQLKLSITDTGSGIAPENISKVFDPFFTTKKVGEGTGLGLAVVNSIIESHEGEVTVKSEQNHGTSFIITFPTCGQHPLVDKTENVDIPLEKNPSSGKKHVLIVEDEPHISRLYQEFIKEYGYQTTVCEDGKQALEAFNNPDNHFDLVLTDQAMPNVTGKELSIILLNKNPKLPIIMCTGYSEVISEELAEKIGIRHYFLKPASLAKLMTAIDNLLKE